MQEHLQVIGSKDEVIAQKNDVIGKQESLIRQLESEIKRLQDMLAQGDQDSSEIRKLLTQTQKQLFEAEERINKLMGEVNEGNLKAKQLQEEI